MSDRFFVVAFRWVSTPAPDISALEAAVQSVGYDWARLNIHTWMVRSTLSAEKISDALRIQLKGDDSLLVIAADHAERHGWMPNWFWEWFRKPAPILPPALPKAALPTNPISTNALTPAFRKVYYVVLHQGAWKILVDGVHYGPYSTQRDAITAAVNAAHKFAAQSVFYGAQVMVQGENNQFRTEWTYNKDPYPPKG